MKKIPALALLSLAMLSAFAVPSLASNEALVIMQGLPIWMEKSGKLEWKESLIIGDRVVLLNRSAKFKQDGKEREYLRVRSPGGNEGWVRSSYVVAKAIPAVVKGEGATIYAAPRDVNMTAKRISPMTIVAALQEGGTGEFAKIVCYDAEADAYYTDPVFVSRNDLSFAEVDINSVILFTTAKAAKDKNLRANFLKSIESKYSASIFFDRIKSVLSPAPAAAAPSRPSQPAMGTFVVNDSKVNVRSTPDELNGQVLAQLEQGATVQVIEVTTGSYTVGGLSGPWYRISDPSGWVFGPFLSAQN